MQILCLITGFVHKVVRLDCDSQSEIFLEKDHDYNANTKHIDVQYHFVRDMVEDTKVFLEKFGTLNKVVGSLTKYINITKFSWFRESIGIDSLNL